MSGLYPHPTAPQGASLLYLPVLPVIDLPIRRLDSFMFRNPAEFSNSNMSKSSLSLQGLVAYIANNSQIAIKAMFASK
ncbi:hypothetical protein [Sphingobacterium sp. LRF_L2]|uniref:hypothetical protein n=1 Tax=Sphingobacterium sp. LRF_L2 TaxID=3369421 RepID=UPI003F5D60E4